MQLSSSFSTSVKEDDKSDGHTLHECSTENGTTNGWDIKLPDGQHPRLISAFTSHPKFFGLVLHNVYINPLFLNTANHKSRKKILEIHDTKKKQGSKLIVTYCNSCR